MLQWNAVKISSAMLLRTLNAELKLRELTEDLLAVLLNSCWTPSTDVLEMCVDSFPLYQILNPIILNCAINLKDVIGVEYVTLEHYHCKY